MNIGTGFVKDEKRLLGAKGYIDFSQKQRKGDHLIGEESVTNKA